MLELGGVVALSPECRMQKSTSPVTAGRGSPSSGSDPGSCTHVSKPSPRTRAREMFLKSPSVRMLENEGGSSGMAFAEFGYGEISDDDLSLSCLNAVKKMQETGRWSEAQGELERVINLAKTERERGMGSLLLAELFNKWGAASQSYSVEIMDRGACAQSLVLGADPQLHAQTLTVCAQNCV